MLEDAKRAGLSRCQAKGWKTLRCVSPVACAKAWTDGQISFLAYTTCCQSVSQSRHGREQAGQLVALGSSLVYGYQGTKIHGHLCLSSSVHGYLLHNSGD